MSGKRRAGRTGNSGPRDPHGIFNEGARHHRAGRLEAAEAYYKAAIELKPDYADAHQNLGYLLASQGLFVEARARYRRTLAINPNHLAAHNNIGNLLKYEGRLDEAMAHYAQAIAIDPADPDAYLNRAEIKTFNPDDDDLAVLEGLAGRGDLFLNVALGAHFALGKACEEIGDYKRAFEHLHKGNALKRQQINYDEQRVDEFFRRHSTVFDRSLFDRFLGEGDPSTVPIFVLGMPRSGSSLVEQILASHPQIHGAGELRSLDAALNSVIKAINQPVPYPDCVPLLDGDTLRRIGQGYLARLPAMPAGKVRIVDKLPGNFVAIGLIRLVLPNARIIHTTRDPIDTCVSCYSKLFVNGQDFTYDLEELGRYYRRYSALMDHWRSIVPPGAILDIAYEDVVDNLEAQARRLIDYCGLPWDDNCINFHTTTRPVRTASSVQVRKPLFRSSLQRWRRYEAEVAPLLRELGDVVPPHAPGGRGRYLKNR